MSKKSSIILYFAAVLILSCGFIVTVGSFILKDLKYYAKNTFDLIEQKTGYIITVDDIDLTIIKGAGLRINHLSITEPAEKRNLLSCKNVELQIRILPLFKKEIVVSRLILNSPEFSITGKKDGDWTKVSLLPFSLNYKSTDKDHFRFIFAPRTIILRNGRLLYKNSIQKVFTSLDDINAEIRVLINKSEYILNASAKHFQKKATGDISIDSRFTLSEADLDLQNISSEGIINLSSIPASGFIPDIKKLLNKKYHGALLNGDVHFTLLPGLKFKASGRIQPDFPNLSLKEKSIIEFKSRGSQDKIFIDNLDFNLSNSLNLSCSANLLKLTSEVPEINVLLNEGSIDIPFLKDILNSHTLPGPLSFLFNKFESGKLFFTDTTIKSPARIIEQDIPFLINGSCRLANSRIHIYKDLPLVNIIDSNFSFTNKSITGTAEITAFENDNSTVDINIRNPFNKPAAVAKISSRCPIKDIDVLLKQNVSSPLPQTFFQGISGVITSVTTVEYSKNLKLTSIIDLSSSEYKITDHLLKPKNLNNFLQLKSETVKGTGDINYNFRIENSLELTGSLNIPAPVSINGTCKFNNFDMGCLRLPLFPETLDLSGRINGNSTYRFPSLKKNVLPFSGKFKIDGLTLTDKLSSKKLITINTLTEVTDQNIRIDPLKMVVGVSDLTANGIFYSALPPTGSLSFNHDFLDIDDFIKVICTIIKRIPKKEQPIKDPQLNPFLGTDLDIDQKVKKGNFLKWDFDNATSRFSHIGSTLTWYDINLSIGKGSAQGKVIYDYINPGKYRLELYPTKTDLDFTTLIPGFKKEKKLTGKTNLFGSFTSTYKKGAEIIPNMKGLFSLQIKNGIIRRSKLVSKSIDKVSFSKKISPEAPEKIYKNMPFDSLDADLTLQDNIIKTDDLILKSPALNLTAIGSINLNESEVDFIVGTQVLKTIGKILGNIPIAGDLFTIDNKALTLGYFHVKGSFDNPSISALPFKSLGLGIKRFFTSILDIPMIFIPDNLFENTVKDENPPSR